MGYLRARDSLRKRSTTSSRPPARARRARSRPTSAPCATSSSQLAGAKMTVDAARGFSTGFDELEKIRGAVRAMRRKVDDWYETQFLPEMRRILGKELNINEYLPIGPAAYYLQYHYIVANPHPRIAASSWTTPHDGSAYSRQHAIYHPLLRSAAAAFGFFDLMLIDARTGRIVYGVAQGSGSRRVVAHGTLPADQALPRRSPAAPPRPTASAICFEDFAPYAPSGGAPIAFMAAPIVDQGQVIAVLVAQLSIQEIDNVVTGDRQWRQDGFGATGEAYLVGADSLVRSAPRAFYENRDLYFAEPERRRAGAARMSMPSAATARRCSHQHIDTEATRAALGRPRRHQRDPRLRRHADAGVVGAARDPGDEVGADRQDRQRRGAGADKNAATRPDGRSAGWHSWWFSLTSAWLSRSLLGPLRELTAGVRLFAAGDYGAKVAVRTRDEIGALCAAFNRMVDESAREERADRKQESRDRGAAPERAAGAHRQSSARRRAEHRRRLRRGDRGVRRHRRLHPDVRRHAAGRRGGPAQRPVQPLRRCRPRARHREDQDGRRRLHGGVRHAGAGARPRRAHGAHGDPHGLHHPRACDGAQGLDEAARRRQQRAGGRGTSSARASTSTTCGATR